MSDESASRGPRSSAAGDDSRDPDRPVAADRDDPPQNRRRAALATLPFVCLGLAIVGFGVVASPRPLFGFLVFPPVAALSVLTYLAFRERLGADRP